MPIILQAINIFKAQQKHQTNFPCPFPNISILHIFHTFIFKWTFVLLMLNLPPNNFAIFFEYGTYSAAPISKLIPIIPHFSEKGTPKIGTSPFLQTCQGKPPPSKNLNNSVRNFRLAFWIKRFIGTKVLCYIIWVFCLEWA